MRRPVLAALGALLLSAGPVLATGPASAPTFPELAVWLNCSNQPSRVYQVTWASNVGSVAGHVPWDTTAPTQSVTQGAGCGGFDRSDSTTNFNDVPVQGYFTGNVREVTVRLHQLVTHKTRPGAPERLRVAASIGSIPVFPPGNGPTAGRTVTVVPRPSADGLTEMLEFTITDLGRVDPDGTRHGLAYEDGDGVEQHELALYVGLDGVGPAANPTGYRAGAWVWDTTEVPSGLVFNPRQRAAATVRADTPVFPDEEPEESPAR